MDLTKINKTIDSQIELTNTGIQWVDTFLKSEKQQQAHDNLVNIRRKLKKIKYAFNQNPSVVLYGESQVGKSYLVNNLLAIEGESLKILNPADGKEYDFIEDINPEGGGAESTSLVSRFSTQLSIPDNEFPVKIKLLSIKDVILFLVDSYHFDIENFTHLSTADLEIRINDIIDKKVDKSFTQFNLTEDDIYDLKDYFNEFFTTSVLVNNLKDVGFWETFSKVIKHIKPNDWISVFELLWNGNKYINLIFAELLNTIESLGYAEEAFMEFNAVLRKTGTILDVKRLREIYNKSYDDGYVQDVKVLLDDNRKLTVSKNYLCAVVSELTFKLNDELNDYKPFLNKLDILDFPGARSRLKLNVNITETESIPDLILRGKVAYIFNKYSVNFLISNLLFCTNSKQPSVTYIPRLLNSWINNFIGENQEERERFLQSTKIPPLFVIYTWYNTDLKFDSINYKSKNDLNSIWERRYIKFFENEIVGKNYDWHIKWRKTNPNFKNNYMLRDLHKSEEFSNIFSGYIETGEEKERNNFPNYEGGDYWKDLKDTFLEYPFVKKHFSNPEQSWQETSTLNNDGSKPIIRNLTIASESTAREDKFMRDIKQSIKDLYDELHKYYHDEKADNKMKKAIQKAGKIQLELETTFGINPYFFGELMQKLMVRESEIYNFYRKKFDEIEIIEQTDFSKYLIIRSSNPGLKINVPFEENLNVLRKTYGNMSKEDMIAYFEEMDIDLEKLFNGEALNLKTNSSILASSLVDKWLEEHLKPENFKSFTGASFTNTSIEDLLDNIKLQTKELQLKEMIAKSIRNYVDIYDKIDKVFEMIADISTAIINKFINTMGYAYYSDEKVEEIKANNKDNDLQLVFEHDYLEFKPMEMSEISELFVTLDNFSTIINQTPLDMNAIKNVPHVSNFQKWKDMMRISFVSTFQTPTYNRLANQELGEILEKAKQIKKN